MPESFEYLMMTPPEVFKPFDAMSLVEASRFFDWYVEQEAGRVDVLRKAYVATGGQGDLDCSRESLLPLWAWFFPLVAVESAEAVSLNNPAGAEVSNENLAASTLSIAVDIGYYLATIFQKFSPKITWKLWTKSKDYYFQRPVLTGFGRYPLVPHDPVVASCWRATRGQGKSTELVRVYDLWRSRVE